MLIALTSRNSGDAVSDALNRLSLINPNIITVDVADLVESARLYLTDDGCNHIVTDEYWSELAVKWEFLLNRAFLSGNTLAVSKENSRILQTELEQLLRDHINNVPNASARAGMYSLCGDYLPLYLQWQKVKENLSECLTPNYQYAFGSVPPKIDGFVAPIFKTVFDFRTWKANAPPKRHWHTFVVDRPAGNPVVAVVIGGRVFFSVTLSIELQQRLNNYSIVIGKSFGSAFCEILYFISDNNICFAAHSHVVKFHVDEDVLDQAIVEYIDEITTDNDEKFCQVSG
jgi:hypothetical protein